MARIVVKVNPVIRETEAGDHISFEVRCATGDCDFVAGPHVVKAAAEEHARWHRELHRRERAGDA